MWTDQQHRHRKPQQQRQWDTHKSLAAGERSRKYIHLYAFVGILWFNTWETAEVPFFSVLVFRIDRIIHIQNDIFWFDMHL